MLAPSFFNCAFARDDTALTINPNQVGGSNLIKQQEQLGSASVNVKSLFDFCFPENGLVAFRLGETLASTSFIQWLGEDKYQDLVNFTLRYLSGVKLPKKRGTFIEFRNGMINISPVGRNASGDERDEFQAYVKFIFPSLEIHIHLCTVFWVEDLILTGIMKQI